MTKEKKIWIIANNILETHGYMVDNISIHDHKDGFDSFIKIYCSDGYCWELKKELIVNEELGACDSHLLADENDWDYQFSEPWDDFKESGIDKAIELLGGYGIS
tara:strand:- start:208 stop:519 length:312 start_codon:yes stop_codon:yes gene_type:complete